MALIIIELNGDEDIIVTEEKRIEQPKHKQIPQQQIPNVTTELIPAIPITK